MKKAFTLAEVLITLGIIGVVVALTLPVIVQNHIKETTVKKIQQNFSLFEQINKIGLIDNETFYDWDASVDRGVIAENFVKEGRGDDILPFLFVDFSPMSANTLLQWYSNKSFKNCPILSGDGETESLNKISVNGVFIIGEKDSCTGGNAFEFASKINSYTKNPKDNEIVIIPDAGHVFYNKHNEYAETVLNYIKSKELVAV